MSETRLIRASGDLLDFFGTRTEDGRRLTAEWGEPIGHCAESDEYIYEPTFTAHEGDSLDAAWRDAEEALPEWLPPDSNYATDWTLSLERDVDPPYYRARATDRTRAMEDAHYFGVLSDWQDTPAAALRALAARLRERAG